MGGEVKVWVTVVYGWGRLRFRKGGRGAKGDENETPVKGLKTG